MKVENVPNLKINKLSKEQYERELANGNIDSTALYMTPDTTAEDIAELQSVVSENSGAIEQLEGDVANLYYVSSDWERVITDTYSSRKTAKGQLDSYSDDAARATVARVHGSTEVIKSKNLIDLAGLIGDGITVSGVTCAANNNILTFRGITESPAGFFVDYLPATELGLEIGKTYTLSTDYNFSDELVATWIEIAAAVETDFIMTAMSNVITFTVKEDTCINIAFGTNDGEVGHEVDYTISFMLNEGEEALPYEDYREEIVNATFSGILSQNADGSESSLLELAEPIELGQWDYIDFENQEIVRRASEDAEPTVSPFDCENVYTAYKNGTETILPEGNTVTVTQRYYVKTTSEEEFNVLEDQVYENTENIEKLLKDTDILESIGSNLTTTKSVTGTYTSRKTAGGLKIIDGEEVTVTKITGTTKHAYTKNEIDLAAKITEYGYPEDYAGIEVITNNNTITFRGIPSNDYSQVFSCPAILLGLVSGKTYTFSQSVLFDYEKSPYYNVFIGVNDYSNYYEASAGPVTQTITQDTMVTLAVVVHYELYDWETPIDTTVSFMINEGEFAAPYEDYSESAVKEAISYNSVFRGIVSANQDGSLTSSIVPSTPIELAEGDYISMSAQRVYRAGVSGSTVISCPTTYIAWNNGNESFIGGDDFIVEQKYIVPAIDSSATAYTIIKRDTKGYAEVATFKPTNLSAPKDTEKYKIANMESLSTLSNRIDANEENISDLTTIALNTTVTSVPVTDAYSTRTTADGLQIFDGLNTTVSKIEGSTKYYSADNKLNLAALIGDSITTEEITVTADNNKLAFSGTLYSACNVLVAPATDFGLIPGKTYTFSQTAPHSSDDLYYTFMWCVDDTWGDSSVETFSGPTTVTITENTIIGINVSLNYYEDGTGWPIELTNAFMVNEGPAAFPYRDYVVEGTTDTIPVHAVFKGIESANEDGSKIDNIIPNEPIELGTGEYIDLTQQLVCKGWLEKTWTSSSGWTCYQNDSYNATEASWSNIFRCSLPAKSSSFKSFWELSSGFTMSTANSYYNINEAKWYWSSNYLYIRPSHKLNIRTTTDLNNWLTALANAGTPLTFKYEGTNAVTSKISCPATYIAWNNGTERSISGDEFTVTQEYFVETITSEAIPSTAMKRDENGYVEVLTPNIPWGYELDDEVKQKAANIEAVDNAARVITQNYNDYVGQYVAQELEPIQAAISENVASIGQLEGDVANLYYVVSDWERDITGEYSTRVTANNELSLYPSDTFKTTVTKIHGKTVKSKNLLDLESIIGTAGISKNGFTVTADNNILTISGTPTVSYNIFATFEDPLWLQVGKTYTVYQTSEMTYGDNNAYVQLAIYKVDPTGTTTSKWLGGTAANPTTFTVEAGFSYKFQLVTNYHAVGTELTPITIPFMACEGSSVLPYEPYCRTVYSEPFVGIMSTGSQLLPQNEPLTIDGQVCYSTKALSLGKEYKLTANQNVLQVIKVSNSATSTWDKAFGSDQSAQGAVSTLAFKTHKYAASTDTSNLTLDDKYIFIKIKVGETSRYATAKDIETYGIKLYEATEGSNYNGYEPYQEDVFELDTPIELGAWDYIDVANQELVRQTCYIDCTKDGFSLGSSTGTEGVTQFWVAFGNAPKVYDKQYSNHAIIPNHTYTVGHSTSDKWVFFGRTAQDILCLFFRNDDMLVFNEDGTLDSTATNAAMRAHLINTGFQFACKPSEELSREPFSCATSYTAYKGGIEAVLPRGSIATVSQGYYIETTSEEEFNVLENKISTHAEDIAELQSNIGDIESALDAIIAIQNNLMGV